MPSPKVRPDQVIHCFFSKEQSSKMPLDIFYKIGGVEVQVSQEVVAGINRTVLNESTRKMELAESTWPDGVYLGHGEFVREIEKPIKKQRNHPLFNEPIVIDTYGGGHGRY